MHQALIQAAARRAGVEDVNVDTLRHSAATVMLDGGVHLKAVSELLGHAGTQITSDVYAHLDRADRTQGARRSRRGDRPVMGYGAPWGTPLGVQSPLDTALKVGSESRSAGFREWWWWAIPDSN